MTAVHQLESTLRSLKLSGMLDTLEVRLVQARAGELGHLANVRRGRPVQSRQRGDRPLAKESQRLRSFA